MGMGPGYSTSLAYATLADQGLGWCQPLRRDLSRLARPDPGVTAVPRALRPTAGGGAGLTVVGVVSPGPQMTVQRTPFSRKSSVWVAQSRIRPGRSSLKTDTATRRAQSST